MKTLCCGICGTDLHAAKHTQQFVDRSRRAGGRWPMDPARDVVFGHEFCCEIVEHGPGHRTAPEARHTGLLDADDDRRHQVQGIGYSNDIAGGFAQYMPLAERLLLEVPNGLPADKAALTEPIAVGWHAVQIRAPGGGRCAAGDRLRSGRAVGDRRPDDPQRAPDHRRGFLAGATCAGAAHGRRCGDRSGGELAVSELAGCRDAGGL